MTRAASPTFTDLYDEHVREVYRWVHRRCRDSSLAEDVTQESFMKAIRSGLEPSAISIGWLITVARNHLYDLLRRELNYRDKLRLVGAGEPETVDTDVVERIRVERAMAELRLEHRIVLTMRYLDDLSVAAIADELGRTAKSVEGLITRARRELSKLLDGESATCPAGGFDG